MSDELEQNFSWEDYIRWEKMPTIWCAGCGLGTIMRSISEAFAQQNLDPSEICMVGGIGCSSRTTAYQNVNTIHTTHGRAVTFATGLKMARPDLNVVCVMGDGDASAIGGNHLIHACRRNLDITAIVMNNHTYGMTSGQGSPTTPHQKRSATTPYGNPGHAFDLCHLAKGAGASYVARATAFHYTLITKLVVEAMKHQGFSFVEIMFQCPTYYGRFNKLKSTTDMLLDMKERATRKEVEPDLDYEQYQIGVLHHVDDQPEFSQAYRQLVARAQCREK